MIAYLVDLVDGALVDYLEVVFNYVATPLGILLKSAALVAVLFIAINHVMQVKKIAYTEYLLWGIRYMLIYMFALVWGNFSAIYTAVTQLPEAYGKILVDAVVGEYVTHRSDMLDVGAIGNEYMAIDVFADALFWMAADFFRDISFWSPALSLKNIAFGVLIAIIGGIWIAVCAIVILIAKVGFLMSLSLAPLAICMGMLEQTRQYFDSWLRFAVSFLVIPLFLAALTTIVLYIASALLVEMNAGSNNKEVYLYFAVIMVAAFVLVWKLPEMGQAISGSAVGAAGVGLGRMAASFMVKGGPRRLRDAGEVADNARKAGASPRGIAWAAISGMRQSAQTRQHRRDDRMAHRMPGTERADKNQMRQAQPPDTNGA